MSHEAKIGELVQSRNAWHARFDKVAQKLKWALRENQILHEQIEALETELKAASQDRMA